MAGSSGWRCQLVLPLCGSGCSGLARAPRKETWVLYRQGPAGWTPFGLLSDLFSTVATVATVCDGRTVAMGDLYAGAFFEGSHVGGVHFFDLLR